MSIRALSLVWETSKHKGGDLLVALALADYANEVMEAWPSVKSLCDKARMGERNVQYCLRKLVKSGEWQKVREGGMIEGRKVTAKYRLQGCKVCTGATDFAEGVQSVAPNPTSYPSLSLLGEERTQSKNYFAKLIPYPLLSLDAEFALAWKDFVEDRKERKKALTERSAKMLLLKLCKRPSEARAALEMAIEKGWRGFEWEWYDGAGATRGRRIDVDTPAAPVFMSVSEQQRRQREGMKK